MTSTNYRSRCNLSVAVISALLVGTSLVSLPASAEKVPKKTSPARSKNEVSTPPKTLLAIVETRSRIQRVARLYLEIAAASRTEYTIPMFTREVSLLDANITKLEKVALTADETKVFNRIQSRYEELRTLFVKPYNLQNGELVYATSEELMALAQKLALLSAQSIDTEAGYALDISSRVMAQTERIAKAFMQCALTQSRSSLVDLEQWRKEHATGLSQLAEMKINDGYTYYNLNLSVMLNKQQEQYVNESLKLKRCTVPTGMLRSSDAMWSILESTNTRYFNQMRKPVGIG